MNAARLVRAARKHARLTQRQLAERSGVPQPMLSAIERGDQDPRFSTLRRILAATGEELDLVMRAGDGVDRTQFIESLRLTPEERLSGVERGARWLRTLEHARRSR